MNVDNLYQHAEGDFYCLLSPDAPMKHPESGEWVPGVIYTGTDGKMRSTTQERFDERFEIVRSYLGEDEEVMSMIRRCNPGNTDFDFIRVFESWHEAEIGITANMLELAVAACIESFYWGGAKRDHTDYPNSNKIAVAEITIGTEDLQRVLQTYDIERVPIPHGFTFRVSRPPEAGKKRK